MALVLVAEDDPDIRELVALKLGQNGFEVRAVGDGLAALEALRLNRPDLVILDVMMPGMSGLDVCRRLRADPDTRGTPVILLTARAQQADLLTGTDVGADDYVTKPFSPTDLLGRVRAVLGGDGA
jgi:two-component system phosphate regulon response regulator PhoB